jgi:hypothetical protein
MADPTLALHTALIAALDTACSCDVWDAVPQGAAYPYVTIDFISSDNMDFTSSRLDLRHVYLSVWSRSGGQAEIMGIIAEIETLNEQPLTLSTGTCVSLRVDSKRTYREPDALTFRGQVILRIYTTHS